MPARAANRSVSSTSRAVPDGWPWTERLVEMSGNGLTSMGSGVTPSTISSPLYRNPSTMADIAAELARVASTTCAPPRACSRG